MSDTESLQLFEDQPIRTAWDAEAETLAAAMRNDKKAEGSTMHLVVPEAIGRCCVLAVPVGELTDWLRLGGFA